MLGAMSVNRHAMRQLIIQTIYSLEVGENNQEEAMQAIEEFVENIKNKALEDSEIRDLIVKNLKNNNTEEELDITSKVNEVLEAEFTIEAFYFTTLEGVLSHIDDIDMLISDHLEGWSLARLNKVDKAILRLAVYEMMVGLAPTKIIINEAIELTKSFTDTGDKKSPNFNNKLLDKIGKTLEKA
jgi:N utilization substance protein B